ncbi:hypothetical protein AAHA92_09665 [Salvia divinorum]
MARAKMAVGVTARNEAAKSTPSTGNRDGRGKAPQEASGRGGSGGGVVGAGHFVERTWDEKGGGLQNGGYSDEEDTWAWH